MKIDIDVAGKATSMKSYPCSYVSRECGLYETRVLSFGVRSLMKNMGLVTSLFIMCIREYGSTPYVGLARAVSPTNTNFRLTFLLTRLQEALYEELAV